MEAGLITYQSCIGIFVQISLKWIGEKLQQPGALVKEYCVCKPCSVHPNEKASALHHAHCER